MQSEPQPPDHRKGPKPALRPLYLGIGLVCVGLGTLGAFLPVLPTTVFLIIALWAFSRSSERLHHWLYTHPRFGARLQAWHEHGVIPVRVKVTAVSTMLASLGLMAFVARLKWPVLAASSALMLVGATYVLSRPSRPPR